MSLALRTKSPIFANEFVLKAGESSPDPPAKPKVLPLLQTKRERALRLVREGQTVGASAFTSKAGAFAPFQESDGSSYRKAIQKYDEALQLCPDLAQAYAARSTAYYFLGNMPAAQKDARTALRLGKLREHELMLLHAPFQGEESRQVTRRCMKLIGPKSRLYAFHWFNLASTYWYEGKFAAFVKELEALRAWEKAHPSPFGGLALKELGRGYEALGDHKRAEQAALEAQDGEMLARLYIHQQRWEDARATLQRYPKDFEADEQTVLSAGIDELEGKLEKVSPDQMAAAQRLAGDGNYYEFFLGLFQLRDGQNEKGRETLQRFYDRCQSNPREWGVTMAWECRRVEEILGKH